MLKRFFMLVLLAAFGISLVGCAWCERQGRVETTTREAEVTQPAPPPPPPAYQPAPRKARN